MRWCCWRSFDFDRASHVCTCPSHTYTCMYWFCRNFLGCVMCTSVSAIRSFIWSTENVSFDPAPVFAAPAEERERPDNEDYRRRWWDSATNIGRTFPLETLIRILVTLDKIHKRHLSHLEAATQVSTQIRGIQMSSICHLKSKVFPSFTNFWTLTVRCCNEEFRIVFNKKSVINVRQIEQVQLVLQQMFRRPRSTQCTHCVVRWPAKCFTMQFEELDNAKICSFNSVATNPSIDLFHCTWRRWSDFKNIHTFDREIPTTRTCGPWSWIMAVASVTYSAILVFASFFVHDAACAHFSLCSVSQSNAWDLWWQISSKESIQKTKTEEHTFKNEFTADLWVYAEHVSSADS